MAISTRSELPGSVLISTMWSFAKQPFLGHQLAMLAAYVKKSKAGSKMLEREVPMETSAILLFHILCNHLLLVITVVFLPFLFSASGITFHDFAENFSPIFFLL